jgi:hypothetical protein
LQFGASVSIFERQTPETDDPQKHTPAALLLDNCESDAQDDRVPAHTSSSSAASICG